MKRSLLRISCLYLIPRISSVAIYRSRLLQCLNVTPQKKGGVLDWHDLRLGKDAVLVPLLHCRFLSQFRMEPSRALQASLLSLCKALFGSRRGNGRASSGSDTCLLSLTFSAVASQ